MEICTVDGLGIFNNITQYRLPIKAFVMKDQTSTSDVYPS